MSGPRSHDRPLVWTVLHPLRASLEDLRRALAEIAKDNPTLRISDDVEGRIIVSGGGELHLEIVRDRLAREHNVQVETSTPKVIYLETIGTDAEGEGTFLDYSGGHSRYGHVVVRVQRTADKEYEFINCASEGAVPKKYLKAIEKVSAMR